MTLTQITKIRGAGIHTTSNIVSHNINSSGIITATAFKGPFTGSSNIQSGIVTATKIDLNGDIDVDGHTNLDNVSVAGVTTTAGLLDINAGGQANTFKVEDLTDNRVVIAGTGGELEDSGNLTFDGSTLTVTNVSIAGTLTYEDVTNVDSVGLVTARTGVVSPYADIDDWIDVGNNIQLGNAGVVTATSFVGGLPITNGADNRVITASSASAIQGESAFTFDGTVADITGKLRIDIATGGTVGSGNAEGIFLRNTQETDNNAVTIFAGADDYNTAASAINFVNVDHSANYGDISFDTRGSGGYGERLRIEYSGRIGINTTSSKVNGVHIYDKHLAINEGYPITWLQSNSSSSRGRMTVDSGGNYLFQFGSGNDEKIRFKSDGKVGIGSVTPAATLDLQSTDTEVLLRLNTKPAKNGYLDIVSDANRRGVIRFQDTGGTSRWSIGNGDSDELSNTSFHISSGNSGGNAAKLVVTSGGQVRIGNPNNLDAWGQNNRLQVAGNDWSTSGVTIANMAASNIAPNLVFGKSRGTSPGTAVANNDRIGYISFVADDGTDLNTVGAAIVSQITGSPSSNSIPASLLFYAGGNNTSNERLRIHSDGEVEIKAAANGQTVLSCAAAYASGSTVNIQTWARSDGAVKAAMKYSHGANSMNMGTTSNHNFTLRTNDAERIRIMNGGSVNIGGDYAQTTYTMKVTGSFAATTKSFVIDHPTKENHQLRYACLEGPENSVYVRGRSSDPVIELPDYWDGLVHDDSITVNVTPIGNKNVWVESINNNSVTIGSDDSTEYFYTVFAERKDVEKLEVEVEK